MSEKEGQAQEEPGSESAAPESQSPPESEEKTEVPGQRRRWAGRLFFWLVLLGALGAGYYYYLQPQVQTYRDQVAGLQSDLASLSGQLGETRGVLDALRQELNQGGAAQSELQAGVAATRNELASLAGRLRSVETARQGDWEVAEAEYLVRLANQKLLTGRDVGDALQLMRDADELLFNLGYPEARRAREALAADIVRLEQVDAVDYQGIYFRLAELIALANELEPPPVPTLGGAARAEQADQSQSGWRRWLAVLANRLEPFFILRRNAPDTSLVATDQIELQKLRVQILLHEAQLALLAQESIIYRESLTRVQQLLGANFAGSAGASRLAQQVGTLAQREVRSDLPDMDRSLSAMQDLLESLRSSTRASN